MPEAAGAVTLGRVAIVGAGQAGTMLGLALRAADASPDFGLFDLDPAVAEQSRTRGAGHRVLASIDDVLDAEAIILAVPVPAVVDFLERHGPSLAPGTFVVDTGSTKRPVVAAMRTHLDPATHAIGGHPIAGTERPGPSGADPGLLLGAPFVLTPARDDAEALRRGRLLAKAVGSRPVEMDPGTHDRLLARTSHLPHLLAFAMAGAAAATVGDGQRLRDVAGPGFAGATRLAGSDPHMVAGFLASNADQVRVGLADLRGVLDQLEAELGDPDGLAKALAAVRDHLEQAR